MPVLLLLAGCGGSSSSHSAQTKTVVKTVPPTGGPGTYTYKDPSGTAFGLTVPAPPGNALVREIEAHRRRIGDVAPQTYGALTIDNTAGSQTVDLDATADVVQVVTSNGQQVAFQFGDRHDGTCISGAPPTTDNCNALGTAVYNDEVTLDNHLLDTKKALPGAKSDTLLITTTKTFTIKRVFLLQAPSSPSAPVEMISGTTPSTGSPP